MIKKSHMLYNIIKIYSIYSNNMYNYANWFIRQCYLRENYWLRYQEMQKIFKNDEPYKKLMSQSSQCILQVLERNWKSFFESIKDYNKNPQKYLGRPKLPNYREKGSCFTWFLKNNQTYIKDGKLYFRLKAMQGYGFKTNVKSRLIAVRFVPRNDVFILEIVYEVEKSVIKEDNGNIASIDLGLDNLITMSNNIGKQPVIIKGKIIKSINQHYNKLRANYQSKLGKEKHWSKRLDELTRKRFNKIKNYIHHTTGFIVKYCINNDISTLIIGNNKFWKQETNLGKKVNQKFIAIPFDIIIKQLEYKCAENRIRLIITEESYTSGTSFLDSELPIKENYNKSRRIKRGLFKSNKGVLINSDVNGSYQIAKKVIPNTHERYGIAGCLNPIVIHSVIAINYDIQ